MAVDFDKPAHVLVVHGVQVGEDEDIQCDRQIRALIAASLADNHIDRDFVVRSYLYENINDRAQAFHQALATAVTSGKPLAGRSLELVIDAVGDVVTAATHTQFAGIRVFDKRQIHTLADARHSLFA